MPLLRVKGSARAQVGLGQEPDSLSDELVHLRKEDARCEILAWEGMGGMGKLAGEPNTILIRLPLFPVCIQ